MLLSRNSLTRRNAIAGLFRSHLSYNQSCSLVSCNLAREKSFGVNHHYCCLDHENISSTWSSKSTAFHVYDGLVDYQKQRDEVCCASLMLKADNIDVGVPTLETRNVFTTLPWENEDVFCTVLHNQERSRDFLFFAKPPRFYTALDKSLGTKWNLNPRLKRLFNGEEITVTLLKLRGGNGRKIDGWSLYHYLYNDISLYCLCMFLEEGPHMKLPPKIPKQPRPKTEEDPDGGGEDSPRDFVKKNSKTEKTKPMTKREGKGNGIGVSKCCSVLDDTVFFSDVCGSTLDSHHGFVAEYGKTRDVNLGFQEDISEVTLDVSLPKKSVEGELYFQGTRYDNHGNTDVKSEVANFAPSRSSHYVNIIEPLYWEWYTFDPTFFFTPSFLKAINGDTVESFRNVISVSSPGVYISEMLQPRFCEMMLSKVEKLGEWVNVTNIQIMRPNTMSKYGIVLDDFGLDSMLDNIMDVSPEVCGSTFDSRHGFVVEYGTDRDVDLGFHVDVSETTLSVCLGKQFEGGEHDVNTDTKPEETFDSHTPGQAVLRHGARATTSGHGANMILWSRSSAFKRDEKISEGILKLVRSMLLRKERKAKPDSWCRKKGFY